MEPQLDLWKGIAWGSDGHNPVAYCPKHRQRLEIVDEDNDFLAQDTPISSEHVRLSCPYDSEGFPIDGGSFWVMRRRYSAAIESDQLKNATYRDLDNIYTPVLTVDPKPKDKRYSIQVEVDDTPNGKKLVIYAMDRENPPEKAQIFIDPQVDKITFDSKSDLHPNMIFSKVVAYFKDGKKATLEQNEQDANHEGKNV